MDFDLANAPASSDRRRRNLNRRRRVNPDIATYVKLTIHGAVEAQVAVNLQTPRRLSRGARTTSFSALPAPKRLYDIMCA